METLVYYLFLAPDVTDANAIVDFFEGDDSENIVSVNWEITKRKVIIKTKTKLNLLDMFKVLGVGNIEYYEETGEEIRVHGQYVSDDEALIEQQLLPMFSAGYNF